jgi:1-acyl-sn-glycerol-3-phosphate acyltransferase
MTQDTPQGQGERPTRRRRDPEAGAAGDDVTAAAVPPPRDTIPFKLAQGLCRIATSCFFDLKVWGLHHVPRRGGMLIVSNHQSYLDPVLIGVRLPRSLSYMAKSELFTHPSFAWLIRSLGAFPVRQGSGDVGAMKESIARVQAGHALNIFPEGSRSEDGEIAAIEKGAALVVRRAKVPVVPAAIHGSFDAWPKGRPLFHAHPIRVLFGPPMLLSHLKGEEIVSTIDRTLRELFAEVKERSARLSSLSPVLRGES